MKWVPLLVSAKLDDILTFLYRNILLITLCCHINMLSFMRDSLNLEYGLKYNVDIKNYE